MCSILDSRSSSGAVLACCRSPSVGQAVRATREPIGLGLGMNHKLARDSDKMVPWTGQKLTFPSFPPPSRNGRSSEHQLATAEPQGATPSPNCWGRDQDDRRPMRHKRSHGKQGEKRPDFSLTRLESAGRATEEIEGFSMCNRSIVAPRPLIKLRSGSSASNWSESETSRPRPGSPRSQAELRTGTCMCESFGGLKRDCVVRPMVSTGLDRFARAFMTRLQLRKGRLASRRGISLRRYMVEFSSLDRDPSQAPVHMTVGCSPFNFTRQLGNAKTELGKVLEKYIVNIRSTLIDITLQRPEV